MATKFSELFVGPRPYETRDARLFFGREREARDLLSLVIANPLLLIYAPSGAGKTSLINARLVPMLGKVTDPDLIPFLGQGKGFEVLPTARVSGLIPEGIDFNATSGANIFVFNTLVSWMKHEGVSNVAAERKLAERGLAEKRLADYLEETRRRVIASETDEDEPPPPPRVLIFDQFEEIFTSHFERWQDREGFFEQVNDALRGAPALLRKRDVRRPEVLFKRLAESKDAISQYLHQHFSQSVRDSLERYDGSARVPPESLSLLVEELNTLIRGESIYEPRRFEGVELTQQTVDQIAVVRKSRNFTDLNRALIDAAYSSEIYRRTLGDRGLRVIFSMREDYLAELDPYAHLLSDRLATRYRLERLRRDAALAAVTSPMQYTHLRFSEGVAPQLVENLLKTPVRTASGEKHEVVGEFVETVQLQVVCQTLVNKLSNNATEITKEHLATYGNVDMALQVFYEDSIREVVEETKDLVQGDGEKGITEGFLRTWFEEKLITPAETRGLAYRGATHTEGLVNAAVDVLDRAHIIREERRGGGRWYELSHDRFIYPIKESNKVWLMQYSSAVKTRDVLKERCERWIQSQSDDDLFSESELVLAQRWLDSREAFELGFPSGLRQLYNASRAHISAQEKARRMELENAQKVAEAERLKAEAQQHRAEEQARSARRLRRFTAALAFLMLLAIVSTVLAIRSLKKEGVALAEANKSATELERLKTEYFNAFYECNRGTSQGGGVALTKEALERKITQVSTGAAIAKGRDPSGAGKLWLSGTTLRIRFLGGTPAQQAMVMKHAPEWTRYANINFTFGTDPDAEVRIAFKPEDGSWSYVGTDILGIPKGERTMNLGYVSPNASENDSAMSILHEFGHLLGLLHEFNNPSANIPWNKKAVYEYYERTSGWDKSDVDSQVFATWTSKDLPAKEFDPYSIMMFPFPKELFTTGEGFSSNNVLSEKDKEYIAKVYPRS